MNALVQRVTIQQAPQAPPAPVDADRLAQQIEQQVEQALQQSLGKADQAEATREGVRAAMDRMRAELEAARAQGRQVVIQPSAQDMIPPQAVDISLAFFTMIAFIVVGLPLARAFARRMDRRGQAARPPTLMSHRACSGSSRPWMPSPSRWSGSPRTSGTPPGSSPTCAVFPRPAPATGNSAARPSPSPARARSGVPEPDVSCPAPSSSTTSRTSGGWWERCLPARDGTSATRLTGAPAWPPPWKPTLMSSCST